MFPSLVTRLQDNVVQRPDGEAVVHVDERVTYGTLWERVGRIAGYLRKQGIQSQDRVALLMDNSAAYVASYYGILGAGGAVVALNTATKAVDLLNWVNHSGARFLFVDSRHPELESVLLGCRDRVELVSFGGVIDGAADGSGILAEEGSAFAPAVVKPDDLAAIIYTSGTTGQPKGVMLSHGNLSANVESILGYLKLTAADRIVNVLPLYYSYGNSVLHTHLAVGGTIVFEDNLVYPHRVVQRLVAERATGFSGVPSTFALLLSRVKLEESDLSSLRYLTQAGGPMPPAVTERLQRAVPHARLFVMYGQTEATARLSYLPPERLAEKMGSIGIPIPGVDLEVRLENGSLAGEGQVGEIWARGANVMSGYWQDPDTSAKVLQDGWLRTGDMAYRDADGFLFIQGRQSDMIKSGAHRIHPKEIEEAIAELDGIAEVAVVGIPDEILGQIIKAFIVIRPGARLDAMSVKAHCQRRLATYKIPKQVEFAPELPRTASGKVKKFLLASNDR